MEDGTAEVSPRKRRMQRQRRIRRDVIVGVAEETFIEKGYEETTVDEVALEAGYTKATIYNYFESKDDLYAAVSAKIYSRMYDTIDSHLKVSESDELAAMGDAYMAFIARYPRHAELLDSGRCVLINKTILDKQATDQELTESEVEFHEGESRVGALIAGVITAAMGESGESLAPSRLGMMLGAFNTAIRDLVRRGRYAGLSEEEIRETLRAFFRIIEQGVRHYGQG